MSLKEKSLKMITTNKSKFLEARKVLSEMGITLFQINVKRVEIQADKLNEIAKFSAEEAAKSVVGPIIAEDAGLFIEHLGGFPGPYSSYVLSTLGLDGILKLLEGKVNRAAHFESAVAFCESGRKTAEVFTGSTSGNIATEKRGSNGFGYDPIFIPLDGDMRTFGEMNSDQKNRLSHRARAMKEFGEWYLKRQQ